MKTQHGSSTRDGAGIGVHLPDTSASSSNPTGGPRSRSTSADAPYAGSHGSTRRRTPLPDPLLAACRCCSGSGRRALNDEFGELLREIAESANEPLDGFYHRAAFPEQRVEFLLATLEMLTKLLEVHRQRYGKEIFGRQSVRRHHVEEQVPIDPRTEASWGPDPA
jgi:hypothetical protein